jgi:multiple sugar transport system ATP-binding protein
MNLLKARVEDVDSTSVKLSSGDIGTMVLPRSNAAMSSGDEVTIGLRPHHLGTAGDHQIGGKVKLVERLGNETLAAMTLASGQQIIVALPGDVDVTVGADLRLAPQLERASLFLASGAAVQ